MVALQAGDTAEALRVAQGVQRAQPRQAVGHLLQAEVELARQQPGAAADAMRRALDLEPSTPLAMRLHGTLLTTRREADAARLAASWLRERPRDAGFIAYLGDVALSRKELSDAERHYREVLEIQPNHVLALNNVAWILVQQKRPGAVDLAKKANELLPNDPGLMDTLALALALDNQVPKALEMQRQAMAKAPNDHNLRLTLARIHLQAGNKADARTELQKLVELGDKFAAQAEVRQLLATL
jgi:predicted Zn-dependent protease